MIQWYIGTDPKDLADFVTANPGIVVVDIGVEENANAWYLFYV
jgi:hypothetical protein